MQKGGGGESFFRFPKNHERCLRWKTLLKFTGIHRFANFTPESCYNRLKICSLHFTAESFSNDAKNHLKKYAIPSLMLPTKDDEKYESGVSTQTYIAEFMKNVFTQTDTKAEIVPSVGSQDDLYSPHLDNVDDMGTADPIADVPESVNVGEVPQIKTETDDPDYVDPAQLTDDQKVQIKVEVPDEIEVQYESKYIADIKTEESTFDPLCLNEKTTEIAVPEKRPLSEQPGEENYPSKKFKPTLTEHEVYQLGQAWARAFRELQPSQQLLAGKAIEDILLHAKYEALHERSVIINGITSTPTAGTSTSFPS